jgi:hypothetical protein
MNRHHRCLRLSCNLPKLTYAIVTHTKTLLIGFALSFAPLERGYIGWICKTRRGCSEALAVGEFFV